MLTAILISKEIVFITAINTSRNTCNILITFSRNTGCIICIPSLAKCTVYFAFQPELTKLADYGANNKHAKNTSLLSLFTLKD